MRSWWVNHKQTLKQEIAGGYLWSPQTEARGRRNQFYENMRRAAPGDRVVSYANGLIKYVGVVQDFARIALRPPEFQELGMQWSGIGWLLSVEWMLLDEVVRPKDLLGHLRPLLPGKYSPINPVTGNGNQNAYLAEIDSQAFELLVPSKAAAPALVREQDTLNEVDNALEATISTDKSLDNTVKRQLILARHGQGQFRANVMSRYESCCLTGVRSPGLLIASHIKPWRACIAASERLDGANGLLLAPHVDRLFDRGLLTFEDDGRARVSTELLAEDLRRLGLATACSEPREHFSKTTCEYLAFHRKNVFLS